MQTKSHPILTILMKNHTKMTFQLFPEKAPNTVNNFIDLAVSGYFNGLTFHRVVKGYVIQGGSETNSCTGDNPGFTIHGEFLENGINTGLTHQRGAISMARDDDYNSAATLFFIVHQDAHKLDNRYAAFGKMLEGFDILDQIANVPTLPKEQENKPLEDQVIQSITVDYNGYVPGKPIRNNL